MATSLSTLPRLGAKTDADERSLVDALRARDPQAFHSLVETHYPTMKRVARST